MSSGEPERAERAARKMDVDENYDESGDEDKKGASTSASGSGKATSPVGPSGHGNGFKPAQTKIESPA